MTASLFGWGSSALLVATIVAQILRQWDEKSSKAVSPWLFIGQCAASTGLLVYSVLLRTWVFVALNAVMAIAALVGLAIWWKFRRHPGGSGVRTRTRLRPNARRDGARRMARSDTL